jgi:hypothetical protein
MKAPSILAPLRYSDFRLLWAGMGASYAGDRLQEMSQAWLVASLTSSSALAVGTIGITAAIPQLFMPVGGPRVSLTIRRTALVQRRLGRSELKLFSDWNDGQPGTGLNFKFYRQATNKVAGISDQAAAFLCGFFSCSRGWTLGAGLKDSSRRFHVQGSPPGGWLSENDFIS